MSIKDLVPWRGDKAVRVRRVEDALPAFHHAFDSLFNEFFRGFDLMPFGQFSDQPWAATAPALDVKETDTEYTVTAELPGWDEKDIEVSLSGDVLTIKGEQGTESEEGEKDTDDYRLQKRYGSFSQSVRLPAEVDQEKVSATCKRGVLTVTLPKTEEAQQKVRKIQVQTA